jgi:crotonobetainyl-CoA:carnitine CoA-transferase CaiB-like acyl-CoA transferase
MNETDSNLPLAGIRVLDLGQYIAAPGAAMVLAELGAEVIKIEPLGGERSRHIGDYGEAILRSYNRGKRSIMVDIRSQKGGDVVRRLAGICDVVVQNQRPGAVDKLGLGASQMRALYPRLIYLSITGFGSDGPSKTRPGFDIAAQAESGLMSVTGEPDRLPQKVGAPIIDSTAAHLGAQAVLAALFRRERTGKGASIETSLLEAAMHLQMPNFTDFFMTGIEPKRLGDAQPKNAPAADIIQTSDGMVVISAYVEEHWKLLCQVMNRRDLISDSRFCSNEQRVANRPAMREQLNLAFASMTNEDCVERLSAAGIVVGAVRSYSQVEQSEDVCNSGIVQIAVGADGTSYRTLGLPYTVDKVHRRELGIAPKAGGNTAEILSEAGFSAAEISEFRLAKVVA